MSGFCSFCVSNFTFSIQISVMGMSFWYLFIQLMVWMSRERVDGGSHPGVRLRLLKRGFLYLKLADLLRLRYPARCCMDFEIAFPRWVSSDL